MTRKNGTTRLTYAAYLDHLRRDTARFAEALAATPDDAPVPTCPDWTCLDLLWHLGEVQWFWGNVVARRLRTDGDVDGVEPERPTGRTSVTQFSTSSGAALADALAVAEPSQPCWTWMGEQDAAWVARRQAHEALIHRVDAEATAGAISPLDPALALDGVDEVLRVMYGGVPTWGTFTADPAATVRVTATDSGATWFLTCGTFVGTAPTGEEVDAADLRVADTDLGASAAAQIRGTAADLDCWLWHRPPFGEVEQTGDAGVLATFNSTIAPGID